MVEPYDTPLPPHLALAALPVNLLLLIAERGVVLSSIGDRLEGMRKSHDVYWLVKRMSGHQDCVAR